ncbi:hypothetical protein KAR91_53120 [Candidatus Pacearchaeota archaeon]|nr:hypothetical protein [Candidatus Pacearchaeota archaeon]
MARKTKKDEPKAKKPMSAAKARACKLNLGKALEGARKARAAKALQKIEDDLQNLSGKMEGKLEVKIEEHLKRLDRSKMKDDILKVFYDMGGTRALKKFAKDKPGEYYKMVLTLLKAETDAKKEAGGGVVVNIHGLPGDAAIDITPEKL